MPLIETDLDARGLHALTAVRGRLTRSPTQGGHRIALFEQHVDGAALLDRSPWLAAAR
jgi:hypothetical protein